MTKTQPTNVRCACSDPMCPECEGYCQSDAQVTLYRVDMYDRTGTAFCAACSYDAFDSGLFSTENEK